MLYVIFSFRTEDGGQRAVNVSWTPGFDGNSPIKQYIVQKREVPEFGKARNWLGLDNPFPFS